MELTAFILLHTNALSRLYKFLGWALPFLPPCIKFRLTLSSSMQSQACEENNLYLEIGHRPSFLLNPLVGLPLTLLYLVIMEDCLPLPIIILLSFPWSLFWPRSWRLICILMFYFLGNYAFWVDKWLNPLPSNQKYLNHKW